MGTRTIGTCTRCTGCDPHGCVGAQCTFECRAVHGWVKTGPCPEPTGCDCPTPAAPCDDGHAGAVAHTGCGSTIDCSQVSCLRRCQDDGGGAYSWHDLVTCAGVCNCTPNVSPGPCDAGHVGEEASGICFDDCSPVNCDWECQIVDYELAKTEDCPAGCICPDSLGPCGAGNVGAVTHTDCADPNWA